MKTLYGTQYFPFSQSKRHKSEADLHKNTSVESRGPGDLFTKEGCKPFTVGSDDFSLGDDDTIMISPFANGVASSDAKRQCSDSPVEWLPEKSQSWMRQPISLNLKTPVHDDPQIRQKNFQQALQNAIDGGDYAEARYLLEDLKAPVPPEAIISAVKIVNAYRPETKALFRDLLNHPQVNLNQPESDPLAMRLWDTAIATKNFQAFQLLLESDFLSKNTLNFTNQAGENLYFKLLKNQLTNWMVPLREDQDFNINQPNAAGDTALVLAANAGNLPAVKVYLADPTLNLNTANQEVNALLEAQSNEHCEVYDYLRKAWNMFSMHDLQAFNTLLDESKSEAQDPVVYLNKFEYQRKKALIESILRLDRGNCYDESGVLRRLGRACQV